MKYIIIFFTFILSFTACQDDTIGYLVVDKVGYSIDKLVVRSKLDVTKEMNPDFQYLLDEGYTEEEIKELDIPKYIYGEDYFRVLKKAPWTSVVIEGVEGTLPMEYFISSVICKSETDENIKQKNEDIFLETASVNKSGRIIIPFEHKIPSGEYLLSLKVENEGHTRFIKDIFTVIIE